MRVVARLVVGRDLLLERDVERVHLHRRVPGAGHGFDRGQDDGFHRQASGGLRDLDRELGGALDLLGRLASGGGEPARFAGLGTPNRQVNISLGSNTIWITGPGTRMRVRDFEIGSTPTAILSTTPTRFIITSTLGNYNFPVGATLEVGANQMPGDYSGTFTITLNYL